MGLNKQTTTKNAVYLFQGKMITPATEKSSTTIEKMVNFMKHTNL